MRRVRDKDLKVQGTLRDHDAEDREEKFVGHQNNLYHPS